MFCPIVENLFQSGGVPKNLWYRPCMSQWIINSGRGGAKVVGWERWGWCCGGRCVLRPEVHMAKRNVDELQFGCLNLQLTQLKGCMCERQSLDLSQMEDRYR